MFLNVQYYHIFEPPHPHPPTFFLHLQLYLLLCYMLAKISHTHVEETVVHARVLPNYEAFKTGFLCHKFHEHEIITLMYIYHVLINTLSAHRIHINLDTIFHIPYTCRAQSCQNSSCKVLYPAQDYAKAKASFLCWGQQLPTLVGHAIWSKVIPGCRFELRVDY